VRVIMRVTASAAALPHAPSLKARVRRVVACLAGHGDIVLAVAPTRTPARVAT
jgi:hypothetical protein